MQGSTLPFAATKAERLERRDPRPSIEERYRDRDDYLTRVRAAAEVLARQRYILEEDVEVCVENAAARYNVRGDARRPAGDKGRIRWTIGRTGDLRLRWLGLGSSI